MINYEPLLQSLTDVNAGNWADQIPQQIQHAFELNRHRQANHWQNLINDWPEHNPAHINLNSSRVEIGNADELLPEKIGQLKELLMAFHPWRKGPYQLYGIHLDSEWRSDWKWKRLIPHIEPLANRRVLDVGCGNGYHLWRMLGKQAKLVLGIEPLLLNVLQFQLIRKLHGEAPVYVLPIGLEQIPGKIKAFDSVFSMGVLYHRRSPIDHLLELKNCMRPGAELILETLVIEGKKGDVLVPANRYAKMRNVWFLPSCETLIGWMKRCGFINCRLLDVSKTLVTEQRSTEWMRFHSLSDFLKPDDHDFTCEGLPAPLRAIIVANIA